MRNFFVALAVFIIVVVGLWTIVTRIFRRDPPPTTGQTSQQQKFVDKTTQVRLVTDGAIVGMEAHRSIRITVDPSSRTLEILGGYTDEVLRSQSFANDAAAFKKLLSALDTLGYTRENTKIAKDAGTICPHGVRYLYEATYQTGQPLKLWSSSCGSGRLLSNASSIRSLFHKQIPNYEKLVEDVNLSRP